MIGRVMATVRASAGGCYNIEAGVKVQGEVRDQRRNHHQAQGMCKSMRTRKKRFCFGEGNLLCVLIYRADASAKTSDLNRRQGEDQ